MFQSSPVREILQRIMVQTTTITDFRSFFFFDKFTTPAKFACWKIRFVFVHNFLRKVCIGSKKMVESVDDLKSLGDKYPAHSRWWGPWHPCRERPSHRLWAQRPAHLRDRREQVPAPSRMLVLRDQLISNVKENPRRSTENEQIRILLERQRADSRWLSSRDSKTRELSSLSEEKFIVLIKETNNFDEINNFFMNNYWNKIGIFVKLMRKVSMWWKNWSYFKGRHSTQLRGENWSKIKILSLNSLARYRNCKMILIVWMIREILKMLNQYAVDNPT